jgi:peptidyl-prolyl cis-trans isomerase C
MRRYGVFVGVNQLAEYGELGPLRYAEADAEAMARLMEDCCGVKPEVLTGQQATRANIEKAVRGAGKGNLFVFFYAGHGRHLGDHYHLYPYDTDGSGYGTLSLGELSRLWHRNFGYDHVLAILDACRSEGGRGGSLNDAALRDIKGVCQGTRRVEVIYGCSLNQVSHEFRELGHGLLTHSLLTSLQDCHEALSAFNWADGAADLMRQWCRENRQSVQQSPWWDGPLGASERLVLISDTVQPDPGLTESETAPRSPDVRAVVERIREQMKGHKAQWTDEAWKGLVINLYEDGCAVGLSPRELEAIRDKERVAWIEAEDARKAKQGDLERKSSERLREGRRRRLSMIKALAVVSVPMMAMAYGITVWQMGRFSGPARVTSDVDPQEHTTEHSDSHDTLSTPLAPASSSPAADPICAIVNGHPITESQAMRRIQLERGAQLKTIATHSPQVAVQQEEFTMQYMVNKMVIEQLLDEQAKKAGIEVTEEQLVAEMTKHLAAAEPPQTLDEYKQRIDAQGGNFDVVKTLLGKQMKYVKILEVTSPDAIQVTEADARKYYDEHPDEFKIPEQVRASHIQISTEANSSNADSYRTKAQARIKAEKLLGRVRGGEDFATVAKENSDCPSAAQGGDLGLFGRGVMVLAFEQAAFGLKVGEISDMIETQFGYHIIKVTEHQDVGVVTFAVAKDKIVEKMRAAKIQEVFRSHITSLLAQAKITYPSGETPAPKDTDKTETTPSD